MGDDLGAGEYRMKLLQAPPLEGWSLRAFVAGVNRAPLSWALKPALLWQNGFVALARAPPLEGAEPTPLPTHLAQDAPEKTAFERGQALRGGAAPAGRPSVADYAAAYRSGETTPVDVARRLLERVAEAESLNAVLACHEDDVLEQARASAARFASGAPIGELDGVPVFVKDEVHVRGYTGTDGTSFLRGRPPATEDASCVAALRAAGAIIAGKTTMVECGVGVTGYNAHSGQCRNPWNTEHVTGGSSSGSAAVVAAGIAPIAVACDGGGSIRIPSALCGGVGLKATFERFAMDGGVFELCPSLFHSGVIASCARDAALAYAAMAIKGPGIEEVRAPRWLAAEEPSASGKVDLRGLRIGVYWPWFNDAEPAVVAACKTALQKYEAAGARVVPVVVRHLDESRLAHAVIILTEMMTAIEKDATREEYLMMGLETKGKLGLAAGWRPEHKRYHKANCVRTAAMEAMKAAFQDCDVIVTPSTACTAPRVPRNLETGFVNLEAESLLMRFALVGNLTGYPAISFNCGFEDGTGLPIGFQAYGKPWSEGLLLRLAAAWEVLDGETASRVPPNMLSPLRA